MKNKILMKNLWIIWLLGILVTGCKKASSPKDEHEHEAITTVLLHFSQQGQVISTFMFDDPDGIGGQAPTIDTIFLQTNQTYDVRIQLLNKTKNPVNDLTATIIAQGTAHEWFFLPTIPFLNIIKTDVDQLGLPLGFQSVWQTTSAETTAGVRVKLMHKPFVKGSNDSPNRGHADADVLFPVYVQ